MIRPPKELIDAFFSWLESDPHAEREDFYKDTITEEYLGSLPKKKFIDFFVEFVNELSSLLFLVHSLDVLNVGLL